MSKEGWCLWCQCSKLQIADFSIQNWDISRSLSESASCLHKSQNKGYKNLSLLHIEFCDIVPDTLHLRMRIANKLFNQIVTWAVDQKREAALLTEMKRIGCHFRFWSEKGDDLRGSVTKWYQPNGDQLWRIIERFNISNVLLPQHDRRLVSLDSLSVDQLKQELQQHKLSTRGKKAELIGRLSQQIGSSTKLPKHSRLRVSYEFEDEELLQEDLNSLDIEGLQNLWSKFHYLMLALKARPGEENYLAPDNFKAEARLWASCYRDLTW